MKRYFDLFGEHIATKLNTLIAVVELKRLFQGSMSLEDFHTKALHLVKEAEYPEGDTHDQILRDTLISGIASDKICAKIIKEGKDVTLACESWKLPGWKFPHRDILKECRRLPKSITFSMEGTRSQNPNLEKFHQQPTVNGSSGSSGNPSKSGGKGKKVPLPTDICWHCGKGRHQKGQPCKAVEAVCRNCSIKGHFEKVCMKGKCSTHLVNVPKASNNSTSTGELDYYNEYGDPVYAHMVSVQGQNWKKTFDSVPNQYQFLSTNLEKVRNSVESSKCPTVLLKADTGADVNLMNSKTFDSLLNRK